jgi:hypothetical protein
MPSSTSAHPAVAENASQVTTRAAAPPCTAAIGFPSSLGHAAGTIGFARGWGSRRSSWPGRSPHRRRGHARQRRPCSGLADGWGPFDPRARMSVSLCWSGVKERGVRSNLSRWIFGFKRKSFPEIVKILPKIISWKIWLKKWWNQFW